MGGHEAIEVAKTVMEVADVAWTAMEFSHQYRHHHNNSDEDQHHNNSADGNHDQDLESLRSENRRLRDLLGQNLKLLQSLSESPSLLNNCPPDLYARLVATVDSDDFLGRIRSLQQTSADQFPFKLATESDLQTAEVVINVNREEPSWWVWVSEEMVPSNVEEHSGIDSDSYVVVSEEHVVDGVANFIAKCIVSNPRAQKMSPQELQKTVIKAVGGVSKLEQMFEIWHAGKLFYALATWGLALTGLYRTRAVLKLAATGVHTTSKLVMRAL